VKDDALDLLLAGRVIEDHCIEDMGIGAYEYHGVKGYDSRPQVIGVVVLMIPGCLSLGDVAVLIKECRTEILAQLHACAFGSFPRWDNDLRMEIWHGGWAITEDYAADPPSKAEREYEEA